MTALSKAALKAIWIARFQPTSSDFSTLIDSWGDYSDALESMRAQVSAGSTGIPRFVDATTVAFTQINTVGRQFLSAATTAAAQLVLGGGAFGAIVFAAATTAAAQSALGGGAVGISLFATTTTAAAQSIIGTGLPAATTAQAAAAALDTVAMTPLIMFNHPGIPKALARVETTSVGTQILRSAYGVATVSVMGTGIYNVVFSGAMATAGYAVICTPEYNNSSRQIHLGSAATVTANGFQLYVTDPAGSAATPVGFSFTVYGAKA